MIEARGLTKVYGEKTAVAGVNFTVEAGRVTGFLGPNGAGKSTTMRMIMGLDRPTSGTVTVNGAPFARHAAPLRDVDDGHGPAADRRRDDMPARRRAGALVPLRERAEIDEATAARDAQHARGPSPLIHADRELSIRRARAARIAASRRYGVHALAIVA